LFLLALSKIKNKKKNKRKHDGPIGIQKTDDHRLMDANDDKHDSKREQDNIREFHEGKNTDFGSVFRF
jgi:hypothetical protein